MDRAADYLKRHELISGWATAETPIGLDTADITVDGRECIEEYEGNVSDYLAGRSRGHAAPVTHIGSIHASAVAVGNTTVTQHVAAQADLAGLATFVQDMLRGLHTFGMSADLEEGARKALADAQQELAQDRPDRSRIAAAFERFTNSVIEAGKPVVTAIMMYPAQGQGWLPPAQ